jgi:hypothetical protein
MKVKAKIVIMSHLSDAQEMIGFSQSSDAIERINFAKYLLLHCGNDLEQEIDADYMYQMFQESIK